MKNRRTTNSRQLPLGPRFGVAQPRLQEKNGVVYTRGWVVELMLDLSGYLPTKDLTRLTMVEPAAGGGAFLLPMVERLITASQRRDTAYESLADCLIAYELDPMSAVELVESVVALLAVLGVPTDTASHLAKSWVRNGDFLMDAPLLSHADFVVGNPPYIRLEDIDTATLADYRRIYPTMTGRADIYVGFFEAALACLNSDGVCTFICADRWMFNQYGAALRALVTAGFSVETVIEMHEADAFVEGVSAYPAITVIRRADQHAVVVARATATTGAVGHHHLATAITEVRNRNGATAIPTTGILVNRVDDWFSGREPWPVAIPERLALLKRLEATFPQLEDPSTGTRVTIGVATGADDVYITKGPSKVEHDRLLPLAMAGDTASGRLQWSGHYLINPWDRAGLVKLDDYPRMMEYFEQHAEQLRQRHVARTRTNDWYRTIDRVSAELTLKPKLYIPDIKERLVPVLDRGETYPHHNLYVVLSDSWDLEVLGGLLLSEIAQFFVECYAVRMRGGYLRFQAQYLRRIRVPVPNSIRLEQQDCLRRAFADRDIGLATKIACQLYGIEQWPLNGMPYGS